MGPRDFACNFFLSSALLSYRCGGLSKGITCVLPPSQDCFPFPSISSVLSLRCMVCQKQRTSGAMGRRFTFALSCQLPHCRPSCALCQRFLLLQQWSLRWRMVHQEQRALVAESRHFASSPSGLPALLIISCTAPEALTFLAAESSTTYGLLGARDNSCSEPLLHVLIILPTPCAIEPLALGQRLLPFHQWSNQWRIVYQEWRAPVVVSCHFASSPSRFLPAPWTLSCKCTKKGSDLFSRGIVAGSAAPTNMDMLWCCPRKSSYITARIFRYLWPIFVVPIPSLLIPRGNGHIEEIPASPPLT